MKLYFLRHADALDAERPELDDERPLSPKGHRQAACIAEFLKEIDVAFDIACASPLLRARETAEAILPITNDRTWVKLEIVEELRNETSQPQFNTWLRSLQGEDHVLLVGHNPSLSVRVASLLGITQHDSFSMPKGGLACLKTTDFKSASLEFFVSPKMLNY